MKVEILNVTGYDEALMGIGLSYGLTSPYKTLAETSDSVRVRLEKIAEKLSRLDGGEDKFLRTIVVTLDVTGPLYW